MAAQTIHGVTASVARAIVAQYPSLPALLAAYAACPSERDAQTLLADTSVRAGGRPQPV